MRFTESLDVDILLRLLNMAKSINANIVIIPRVLFQQDMYSSMLGIYANSIVSISKFINDNNIISGWNETSCSYIAFTTNQIAPFIRVIKDNNIDKIYIDYDRYIVNNKEVCIATSIYNTNIINLNTSQGLVQWRPIINLIQYNLYLSKIFTILNKFKSGYTLIKTDVSKGQDKDFDNILNMKADDSIAYWYNDNIKNYIIYLNKTIFNSANKDILELEIRNNIKDELGDVFITRISKIKKTGNIKKGNLETIITDYFMYNINII